MPSTKSLELKQAIVSEIKDKCNSAKSIVLFDYRGLTAEETSELRKIVQELENLDYKYKIG